MIRRMLQSALLLSLFNFLPVNAQIDGRMLRYPDVSEQHITFLYAGDIWIVDKNGGVAQHLSSPKGNEQFPRFSPDGSSIAFNANYDGNTDIYTLPALGGDLTRVTHHGMTERMLDWTADGSKILFASSMKSERQRYNQFYLTMPQGGLPDKLVIPYGEDASFSPDGKKLAYIPISRDFRTWKGYRGGMAPDIWIFDLTRNQSKKITDNPANDSQPMWCGQTIYYLSDRGPEKHFNIWAYDVQNENHRQVTTFSDYDIHFPEQGPQDIVFEAGGKIYLLDLETEKVSPVDIEVVTDLSTLKPKIKNVSKHISHFWTAPDGKRVLFEARGDIFSVPAEHGVIRNLTRSSGSAERFPAWSPDGKTVAFWSDQSGEYELTVYDTQNGSAPETLTKYGPGFRYHLFWAPDNKKLVFIDQAMTIRMYNMESGKTTKVDQALWKYQGELETFQVNWSPDSRWFAYARGLGNEHNAVFIYDTQKKQKVKVTSGFYSDNSPVFDPDGKYLFYLSNRNFDPIYGDVDNSFLYANTTTIVAAPLRTDVESPLKARNDETDIQSDSKKDKEEQDSTITVDIDLQNLEQRAVVIPVKNGNFAGLQAVSGKIIFHRTPRTGMPDDSNSPLMYYDLEEREEKTIVEDADAFQLTADRKKLLIKNESNFYLIDIAADQKLEKPLRTKELETRIDPKQEWQQLFDDAWRLSRDFFYDPNMHGVDWTAMRAKYGKLLDDAVTRGDVNYVIGELIAELNASHTYRWGGDQPQPEQTAVGYLGIDWDIDNDTYRVKRIIHGAPWDISTKSPLSESGVQVEQGDYILAVNGSTLKTDTDPWAAFQGAVGHPVELTVNDRPTFEGARKVIVEPMKAETRLRHLEWIEHNRQFVEKASDGKIGYIYVPNTGTQGQSELVRQFAAQHHLDGLIIDERFNSGGQIPDRFIELLDRPVMAYWAVRDGKDWAWPPVAHFGPKAMLINGWSGSGGDAFPDYFRKAGLGKLVGTRTWGGLIGITGAPRLIDGGLITVPTFRMYNPDGTWFLEGHGVAPDIHVPENPSSLANGVDTQLKRAVEHVLKELKSAPPKPKRPEYENRSRP
ncbi:MAG: PDZ domain-containing protein [candidate division KSB1 bacterium]|nr:PDZ domain-containing protein [candidate division KSB1 bacterium]